MSRPLRPMPSNPHYSRALQLRSPMPDSSGTGEKSETQSSKFRTPQPSDRFTVHHPLRPAPAPPIQHSTFAIHHSQCVSPHPTRPDGDSRSINDDKKYNRSATLEATQNLGGAQAHL